MMSFNEFDDEAKVWVFPSSRGFSDQEQQQIAEKLKTFTSNWLLDKKKINAAFELPYNRFVVIITENKVLNSECIDQLMTEIASLQTLLDLQLIDRLNVSYKQGTFVQYKEMKAFKKMYKEKAIGKDPIVFDNTVDSKWRYENEWEIPLSQSWYRFQLK